MLVTQFLFRIQVTIGRFELEQDNARIHHWSQSMVLMDWIIIQLSPFFPWFRCLSNEDSFTQLLLHDISDLQWEIIIFGMQGMFPCWRKNLYFYWKKAFKRRVLTICERKECLVEITFSPHCHMTMLVLKLLSSLIVQSLRDTTIDNIPTFGLFV